MKKTILFFIITVFVSCNHNQGESNDLMGNWLSVRTDGIDSSGHVILNGYLLNISENQYSSSHIFIDTTITISYLLKNDTVYLNDSTLIEIQSITTDSIKLIFQGSGSVVTYIKLPFTQGNKISIDKEDLTSNSWNYVLDTLNQRIEFLNTNWIFHDDATYELYTHPIIETPYFYYTINRWRIFDYNNRTYFVRTFEQNFGLLHEVYKVTSDTIFTKAWTGNCFEYPFLVKIKPIAQADLNKRQSILRNNQWKVVEIDYKKGLLQDWEISRVETKLHSALNKWDLQFDFKPRTCQMFINDTSFNFQNWKFTKDGNYLRLNSKFENHMTTSFIKIQKISEDTLVMKNRFLFSEILGLRAFDDIDIELQLIGTKGRKYNLKK